MHILYATNQATALIRGGVRTQVLQTKAALESLGVRVTLFDTWRDFNPDEFDLVHIFAANMATYHLARTVKMHNLPLVVSPVFFTLRSPTVVRSVITADRYISRSIRGLWTDYGLIAEICTWAAAVVPNTQREAQLFVDAFMIPAHKITVVPNGTEERFARATPEMFERAYGIKDFILAVGQIGPARKNFLRLIEALEQIDHPAALIGHIDNTPSGRACLELAKRNSRLLIVDAVPHDSMLLASAYAACNVFVLPSLYETPGIAALEAGLAGAKIVITPFGGTTEYFGEEAEYINPYSGKDIAAGIRKMLLKPKSPSLAERIGKEFLWKQVGEETKKVYERVLSMK
jgi:glycosyltransferase involved in cell wall biosynthesis